MARPEKLCAAGTEVRGIWGWRLEENGGFESCEKPSKVNKTFQIHFLLAFTLKVTKMHNKTSSLSQKYHSRAWLLRSRQSFLKRVIQWIVLVKRLEIITWCFFRLSPQMWKYHYLNFYCILCNDTRENHEKQVWS